MSSPAPAGPPVRPFPSRTILTLLVVAIAAAAIVVIVVRGAPAGAAIAKGQPVPTFSGTTLDGSSFDLAAQRGRPVIINFWGPSCGPCVEEMPLLAAKAVQHAAAGVVIVGVLTDDPVEPARRFVADHGGTWPTVIDPGGVIKQEYRIAGRPQSYFVDAGGILRSIQIGALTDADFERQLALITGG